MGMAASQARFLGLTARKTNVEYEGQQINQQRTALSNQSASYYTDLLGMAVPVCPSVNDYTQLIYSFTDGSLENTITSLIARGDGAYNVSYLRNYTDDFSVVGAGATSVVKDVNGAYMVGGTVLRPLAEDFRWAYVVHEETQTYRLFEEGLDFTYTDTDNTAQKLVPATYDRIVSIIGPEPDDGRIDISPLIENYKNTQCYSSVAASDSGMWHLEHNLCRLIWSDDTTSVTSSNGITLTKTEDADGRYTLTEDMSNPTTTDETCTNLEASLKADYPELYQQVVDAYIDAVLYLDNADKGKTEPRMPLNYYTLSATTGAESVVPEELFDTWGNLWTEISSINAGGGTIFSEEYLEWKEKYDSYANLYFDSEDYTKTYLISERQLFYEGDDPYIKSLSQEELEKFFYDELAHLDMLEKEYGTSENGWLVRYKLNTSTGAKEPIFFRGDDIAAGFRDEYNAIRTNVDTYKIGSKAVQTEIKGQLAYLEQDSTGRYINITFKDPNDNMVTYALTTSTVKDDRAYNDAMNQYEFDKAIYEKKIQEINAKIEIIQAEDKNLELRLKQLDTEQDAISNELDAVQKVIEKNVESSFKTFG